MILYSPGYSLKDIQTWLGHSNYKFIADTYVHTEQGAHAAMAERYGKDLEKLWRAENGVDRRLIDAPEENGCKS